MSIFKTTMASLRATRLYMACFPEPSLMVKALASYMAFDPDFFTLDHGYGIDGVVIVVLRPENSEALCATVHLTPSDMWISLHNMSYTLNRAEKKLLLTAVREWIDWSVQE